MIRSLSIAKTGLDAQQTQLDVVSNNLANVGTTGFKRSRAVFEDLMYQNLRQVGGQTSDQTRLPSGLQVGTGVRVVATERIHAQGNLTKTDKPTDVAISGSGFFQVLMPDGSEAYTRVGNLQIGADGQLTTMGGRPVVGDNGALTVPPGAEAQVGADGLVTARGMGDPLTGVGDVGRLKLVNPPTTDLVRGDVGLFRMRDGLPPAVADPAVRLVSGVIEGSNVNPVEAMVDMIANARRFEMQMKSLKTADEGAQSANKLLAYG